MVTNGNPRAQLMRVKESNQASSVKEIAAILNPPPVSHELPPVFPYDPGIMLLLYNPVTFIELCLPA